jgi:hypothetical protein
LLSVAEAQRDFVQDVLGAAKVDEGQYGNSLGWITVIISRELNARAPRVDLH